MHHAHILLFGWLSFSSLTCLAVQTSASVVARVNGEPILEDELLNDTAAKTREERLKRTIQYHLILQEAKKRGIDKTAEVQNEMNALLYRRFLEEERKNRHADFNPSPEELKNYYEELPLIRIRHMVLPRRTETEKQVANLALEQIQKELKAGTPFAKLCTQYSQDASGPFGGDADFRGPHNFPEEFYHRILTLKKNAVSDPVEVGETLHLFQWFDKKPYTAAPASYLQFLQARLTEQKEKALLTDLLRTLEASATIETPSASPHK